MATLLVFLGILVPQCDWVVTTFDGNEYIIGSADTCSEAWQSHGPIPGDWQTIEPRQGYVFAGY